MRSGRATQDPQIAVRWLTKRELLRQVPRLIEIRDQVTAAVRQGQGTIVPFRGSYLLPQVMRETEPICLLVTNKPQAGQGFILGSPLALLTAEVLTLAEADLAKLKRLYPRGFYVGNFFAEREIRGGIRQTFAEMFFAILREKGFTHIILKSEGRFLELLAKIYGAQQVPGFEYFVFEIPPASADLPMPRLNIGQEISLPLAGETPVTSRILLGSRQAGEQSAIFVRGEWLQPADYQLVAPLLGGTTLDDRVKLATGKNWAQYFAAWQRVQRQSFSLIVIDNKCESKCRHCFFGSAGANDEEIDLARITSVVQQAKVDGNKVMLYVREPFGPETPFSDYLKLYKLSGTNTFTTRGERLFAPADLDAAEAAGIKRISFSLQPDEENFQDLFSSDQYSTVLRNIRLVTGQKKYGLLPRFQTVLFMVLHRSNIDQMENMANLAARLHVNALIFLRLTRQGRAAKISQDEFLDASDLEDILLNMIRLKKQHYNRFKLWRLHLGLATAGFGPNYWSKGIWRFQLGKEGSLGLASPYPCPVLSSDQSYALSFPEERPIVCHTMIGDKATPAYVTLGSDGRARITGRLVDPEYVEQAREICQGCATHSVCGGGCLRNLTEDVPFAEIVRTGQQLCLTSTLEGWHKQLLARRSALTYK